VGTVIFGLSNPTERDVSSVLMISYQYAPMLDGGAERQAQRLAEGLAARGRRVGVVTARYPGLPRQEVLNGVRVHRVWALPKRHRLTITFIPSIARFLCTEGLAYEIWHAHQAYYNAWVSILLGRVFNKRCLVKAAASGPYGDVARLRRARLGRWVLRALPDADAFVSLNNELTQELLSAGIESKRVRVIPNGVDSSWFAPPTPTERAAARDSIGVPQTAPVAAYVGRLAQEKGVDVLLDAWQAIGDTPDSAGSTLILAGDGPNAGAYRARADAQLRNVRFLGKVSDVREVLRAADALVLPSLSEGLSNAVLEAMATGLPVVATRIGGLTDQVEDRVTGLLVEPADSRALGEAIGALLSNHQWRVRMGHAGRQVAVQRFGVEAMVDAYEQLYEGLRDPSLLREQC